MTPPIDPADAEKVGEGFEVRGERHDGPDVEITVRPPVEAAADPRSERVVNGGMTESALDTH